jgi:hypothetical protein
MVKTKEWRDRTENDMTNGKRDQDERERRRENNIPRDIKIASSFNAALYRWQQRLGGIYCIHVQSVGLKQRIVPGARTVYQSIRRHFPDGSDLISHQHCISTSTPSENGV